MAMRTNEEPAICAEGVVKTFGALRALDGLDLEVGPGSVVGLLGPSGAGKTTAVRVLTALLAPDGGGARVAGLDVVADAPALRARIGVAAVGDDLTAVDNLVAVGRSSGVRPAAATRRARELLERFGLHAAAGRAAGTYSSGMRRRLDLAAALVARPPVLFVDEPAAGLDPRWRSAVWEGLEELAAGGTAILLTTTQLDAAERLADRIAVIDRGRVIAGGTVDELKARVGGLRVEVRLTHPAAAFAAIVALEATSDEPPRADGAVVTAAVRERGGAIMAAARRLSLAGVGVADIAVRCPTLDDVLLSLTGHAAPPAEIEAAA